MGGFRIGRFPLADHGKRLGLCHGEDVDGSFLIFYFYLVSDMETEGFEPFALHGDLRGFDVG